MHAQQSRGFLSARSFRAAPNPSALPIRNRRPGAIQRGAASSAPTNADVFCSSCPNARYARMQLRVVSSSAGCVGALLAAPLVCRRHTDGQAIRPTEDGPASACPYTCKHRPMPLRQNARGARPCRYCAHLGGTFPPRGRAVSGVTIIRSIADRNDVTGTLLRTWRASFSSCMRTVGRTDSGG